MKRGYHDMRLGLLNKLGGVPQSWSAAAMLVLMVTTAACSRQAASGQSVAVVDGEAITASELRQELNNIPAASREQAKPQVLQAMIDRRLLANDAGKQKLDKTPAFVLAERRMREIMLAQQALQTFVRSSKQPISQTEVNAYLDRHPNIGADRRLIVVNQLQFATPPKPVLEALRPAQTLEQLATILQQRRIPVQGGRSQVDTALISDKAMAQLAKLRPGEPLVSVNGATSVASAVAEQRTVPLNAQEQEAVARRRIESERAQDAVKQRSDSLRQSAKITFGDGYQPAAARK